MLVAPRGGGRGGLGLGAFGPPRKWAARALSLRAYGKGMHRSFPIIIVLVFGSQYGVWWEMDFFPWVSFFGRPRGEWAGKPKTPPRRRHRAEGEREVERESSGNNRVGQGEGWVGVSTRLRLAI